MLGHMEEDYDKISNNFNLELVKEGCLGSCNIYKINLKNEK